MEDKEVFTGSPGPDPGGILLPFQPGSDPKHLPPAIPEKQTFCLGGCFGMQESSLPVPAAPAEPGCSRGFAELPESCWQNRSRGCPRGKPDPGVGQETGDASARVEKPTFKPSKSNPCTGRIHKISISSAKRCFLCRTTPEDCCLNSKSDSIALPQKFPVRDFPLNLRSFPGYNFAMPVISSVE